MEAKNTPLEANPQPQDEFQLTIETVTPDTDKDVNPGEEVTQEQSKDQNTLPEDSTDQQEVQKSQIAPSEKETNRSGEESEGTGDARDQVETVSA